MTGTTQITYNDLLEKYGINLYNYGSYIYNEYPHKSTWTEKFEEKDFRTALKSSFINRKDIPRLLYVHIPFCDKRCSFCLCHTVITNDYDRIKYYLNNLFNEINLLKKFFDENSITPEFQKIHIGGGSPTILHEPEFTELINNLQSIADIKSIKDFAIEIDPRTANEEKMILYHDLGINRISFGIQDFNDEVQKAINRVQPLESIERLISPNIRKYFDSVNFDILCGLPKQTRDSFRETIDTTLNLSPDRIMLMFLTYSPDVKKHQKLMKESEMPSMNERMEYWNEACQTLIDNGYIRIGADAFAKPTDDLAIALKNKELHWDSLGFGSGKCLSIIGLGAGSSSDIKLDHYSQHAYSISEYNAALADDKIPIFRGHTLNCDDIIRREIIHNLRCYFTQNYYDIEEKHDIEFKKYFNKEMDLLDKFVKDGMIELTDNSITINESGKHFVGFVGKAFDKYRPMKSV